ADNGFWVGAPENDKFEGHLASDDLFNLEAYPTARFVATGFETEDGQTGTMTGDLTLKDQTHPVTLDVTLNKQGESQGRTKLGFSASGDIMRSEWGLGYAAPMVSDELALSIETELVAAEEETDEE
ncbi:MAG: YceI family protein, partial [Henriciella sp.]|uniref:YceI family protein n=1 Tax=Henriciella sp. TaxID=1968823 RepID=UPI003C73FA8B